MAIRNNDPRGAIAPPQHALRQQHAEALSNGRAKLWSAIEEKRNPRHSQETSDHREGVRIPCSMAL